MNVKEGDIVALPSVDKKRVIFVYRVYRVNYIKSYRKHLLSWRNNINSVYEVENRRYIKNQELYFENKRLLVNSEIPQSIINDFLKYEEKEINDYKYKLNILINRALSDMNNGYLPSLFYKYNTLNYYIEGCREKIECFNNVFELINDLKNLGCLTDNNLFSYEASNYDFKRPTDSKVGLDIFKEV